MKTEPLLTEMSLAVTPDTWYINSFKAVVTYALFLRKWHSDICRFCLFTFGEQSAITCG